MCNVQLLLFLLEDFLSVRIVFTVFLLLNFLLVTNITHTMSFIKKINYCSVDIYAGGARVHVCQCAEALRRVFLTCSKAAI